MAILRCPCLHTAPSWPPLVSSISCPPPRLGESRTISGAVPWQKLALAFLTRATCHPLSEPWEASCWGRAHRGLDRPCFSVRLAPGAQFPLHRHPTPSLLRGTGFQQHSRRRLGLHPQGPADRPGPRGLGPRPLPGQTCGTRGGRLGAWHPGLNAVPFPDGQGKGFYLTSGTSRAGPTLLTQDVVQRALTPPGKRGTSAGPA